MMANILEDDLSEMYRQRGRWFLLLGALLGGIIAIAAAVGFWLEQWGNHIGGGRGEDVHGIAVALAIVVLVLLIGITLLVWRASTYLTKANEFVPPIRILTASPSDAISAAVAAWTSSALGTQSLSVAEPAHPLQSDQSARPVTPSQGAVVDHSAPRYATVTATQLTFVSDVPEVSLAETMRRIEGLGIEMEAVWLAAGQRGNQVHLVLKRSAESDARLAAADLQIDSSEEVVLVDFEDRSGAAADIIRRLTDAGVRVSSAQLATKTRMVIVSDDPESVARALS